MLGRLSLLSVMLCTLCLGDMYMHMPKGSNNRLNEASANRNNANRCFDSQNNNRGGYNVGEIGSTNGFNNDGQHFNTFAEGYTQGFFTGAQDGTAFYEVTTAGASTTTEPNKQTESFFWENSFMAVTWTSQHGCGQNTKVYCQVIAQYAVENMKNAPTEKRATGSGTTFNINVASATLRTDLAGNAAALTRYNLMRRLGLRVMLQNGANTNTPSATSSTSMADLNTEFQNNVQGNNNNECQHESNEWYSLCRNRDRNKGLFTADQNVNQDRATHTRQNPNGNRRGLECPEERDYYPYWYPTPFVDVAILTDDLAYCEANMKTESQNVKDKNACTQTGDNYQIPTDAAILDAFNASQCAAAQGTFVSFKWNMPAPDCLMAPHQQVNHLGNMITGSMSGQEAGGSQAYFMWKLPSYADLVDPTKMMGYPHTFTVQKIRNLAGATDAGTFTRECARVLFRMRYNISTTDYDPLNTNATQNDRPNQRIISPIKQNPTIEMGNLNQGLRLAINTAQTGRTFQDRSHTMLICKRPTGSPLGNKEILNVQVQGKRGNIVQTFPATEYQFSPRQWTLCKGNTGSVFHFQWTGSNTHNNGNPAGDGQAGDAGEGRGGSDRNNLAQMIDMQQSYPLAWDKAASIGVTRFFDHVTCRHGVTLDQYGSTEDAAIAAATSGYYHGRAYAIQNHKTIGTGNTDNRLQVLFNNAAASYRGGIVCEAKGSMTAGQEFAFLCTRNNNFSNRAQKMKVFTADTCSFAQNPAAAEVGSVNPRMMLG